jgi:aminoglycoside phosphotransferase (APT) family kinase protein
MIYTEPKAEIEINEDMVKDLIASQFPEFSGLEVTRFSSGWDNESYRLGTEYITRMPRRILSEKLLRDETVWLPRLSEQLPIAVPTPVKVGVPQPNYPYCWSIVPWFEGTAADRMLPDETEAFRLMRFLKQLHSHNAEQAPENNYRGVPLSDKRADVEARMQRLKLKTDLITDAVEAGWHEAVTEPDVAKKCLIHADLHPGNIIVENGRIKAIIDWGDITSGDPAIDLACLWMLFERDEVRKEALKLYGASESLTKRSIGWAIFFGTMLLESGLDSNPGHARVGTFVLKNLSGI